MAARAAGVDVSAEGRGPAAHDGAEHRSLLHAQPRSTIWRVERVECFQDTGESPPTPWRGLKRRSSFESAREWAIRGTRPAPRISPGRVRLS
jgi:hypothetical protein